MTRFRRLLAAAFAAVVLAPAAAHAQLGFGLSCTPGIPGCTSLRFSFTNPLGTDVGLDALTLVLGGSAWTFTPGGSPPVGLYSANDSEGPFSGFTTIGTVGRSATIDFTENGFSFFLVAGGAGYLDLEATGPGTPPPARFTATTDGGATITGSTSTVPEPGTLALLGGGVAVLAVGARRRR